MKRLLTLALAILLTLGLGGCSVELDEEPTKEPFDLDAYKALAVAFCTTVEENAVDLGKIARRQNNYWEALDALGGFVTTEKILENSSEWFFEETGLSFSDLEAKYEEHSSLYRDIIMTEIEGKEAEEIESLIRIFFDAYTDLYTLVMSPSGSREDFVDRYNEIIESFRSAQNELAIFLG